MPETEEIVCVAATSDIVACATDARFLRLFTPLGTQRQVCFFFFTIFKLSIKVVLLLGLVDMSFYFRF